MTAVPTPTRNRPGVHHPPSPHVPGPPPPRPAAAGGLFAEVYDSLKGMAHQVRRGRAGETLGTTALVHEAYLRLAGANPALWNDEAHFFAVAARAMRHVLVDAARRDRALKRGGSASELLSFDDALYVPPARPETMLALDSALEVLEARDPRRAQVVEHRVFAGLSIEETARLLGVSTATVERDWRVARAWLAAELDAAGQAGRG